MRSCELFTCFLQDNVQKHNTFRIRSDGFEICNFIGTDIVYLIKTRMFAKFIEYISFFKIVLSPLLIGIICGFALYNYFDGDRTGSILFATCTLAGLASGIIWAVKISRKTGATTFIAQKDASPDITDAVSDRHKKSPENSGPDLF